MASVLALNGKDENFELIVRGFRLPAIEWKGQAAENGTIPASWHDHVQSFKDWKEIFWRTLVADRDTKGGAPPPWYRRACEEAFELSRNQDLNTSQMLAEHDGKSSQTRKFLRRLQAVTWNRQLVTLDHQNLLGLVPAETSYEDHVCILLGCDVPVVLRDQGGGFWEFLGEAYIHGQGVMDGDALNRPHELENFKLV
jgi:hypothetical protein